MITKTESLLSETVANVIENLGCRLAERNRGVITPNHLAPWLPMSLGLLRNGLDQAVDGTSLLYERKDNIHTYTFAAYSDRPTEAGLLSVSNCISCDQDLPGPGHHLFCAECSRLVEVELNRLAERTGWPAAAVYEHDFLYNAARHPETVHAEDLAGRSRYTLRSTRRKLERMDLDGFLRTSVDESRGVLVYAFPLIDYPGDLYRRNRAVIRSHPASLTEEVQLRVVRILIALGAMLFGMMLLGLLHFPFPLLLPGFLVLAPLVALAIWRHRDNVQED